MALQIANPYADSTAELKRVIEDALPGADVEVAANSPGHYQISVRSELFVEKSLVRQQQMVYQAIAELMKGENAPVHAIDRLQTAMP